MEGTIRDRFLPGNVRFPADYGFMPSAMSADSEPPNTILGEVEQFYVPFRQLERDEEVETRVWHGLEKAYEMIRDNTQEHTE
jgi:inorganic pyrophosphatase